MQDVNPKYPHLRAGTYPSSGTCQNGHDRSLKGVKPVKGRWKCVACLDEKQERKRLRQAFQAEHPHQELPEHLKPRTGTTSTPQPPSESRGATERQGSRAQGTNPRAQGTNPRAMGTNPRAMKEAKQDEDFHRRFGSYLD